MSYLTGRQRVPTYMDDLVAILNASNQREQASPGGSTHPALTLDAGAHAGLTLVTATQVLDLDASSEPGAAESILATDANGALAIPRLQAGDQTLAAGPTSPLSAVSGAWSDPGIGVSEVLVVSRQGGDAHIALQAGASSYARLRFGDSADIDAGILEYNNSTDQLVMWANGIQHIIMKNITDVKTRLDTAAGIQSDDFVTGTTGYRVNTSAQAEFRAARADEFHTTSEITGMLGSFIRGAYTDPSDQAPATTDLAVFARQGGSAYVLIQAGATSVAGLMLGDEDNRDQGMIHYNNSTDLLALSANDSQRMRLGASGTAVWAGNLNVPFAGLSVDGGSWTAPPDFDSGTDLLVVHDQGGGANILLNSDAASFANIHFGDVDDRDRGGLRYNNNNDRLGIWAAGNELISVRSATVHMLDTVWFYDEARSDDFTTGTAGWQIDATGNAEFRQLTADTITSDHDLTVGANVLYVDESQANVGINMAPDAQFALDITGNLRASGYIVGSHAIQIEDAMHIFHFDGPGDYRTDDSGSYLSHMGKDVDTLGGTPSFLKGKFNKGIQLHGGGYYTQVYDGRVNSLSTCLESSGGLTVTASTEVDPVMGTQVLKGVVSVSTGFLYPKNTNLTMAVSDTVYVSAWVWIDDATTVTLEWNYNGSQNTIASTTTTGQWVHLDGVYTAAAAASDGYLRVKIDGSASSVAYVDAMMAVPGIGYAIDYFDGGMTGANWSGTAWAARSYVANHYAWYDIDQPRKFTIMYWVKYSHDNNAVGHSAVRWRHAASGTYQCIPGYYNPSETSWRFYVNTSRATSSVYVSDTEYNDGEFNHFAMTVDFDANGGDGSSWGYLNGVQSSAEGTNFSIPGLGTYPWDTVILDVGGNLSVIIDDLVIVEDVLSADEILAIYESNAPVFAESSTWSFQDPTHTIWVSDEGLYALDTNGTQILALSTVDGKSWGGYTLDAGDFLLGNSTDDSIRWDISAGTITFAGDGAGVTNINGGNIQTNTVTATQINVSQLSAISADIGTITAGTITGATIRTAASGARIEMNSTKIFGTDGTTTQWEALASTGELTAGGGDVTLNEDGLRLVAGTPANGTNWIQWDASSGFATQAPAAIYGFIENTSYGKLTLVAVDSSYTLGRIAYIELDSEDQHIALNGVNTIVSEHLRALESVYITDGLSVGHDAYLTGGDIRYTGTLQSRKNSTNYDVVGFVPLTTKLTSTSWDGDAKTTADNGIIDLSSVFSAPAGIKAVLVRLAMTDSTINTYARLGPSSGQPDAMVVRTASANQQMEDTGIVPCDSNGDVYFSVSANVDAVHIQIWGYFI